MDERDKEFISELEKQGEDDVRWKVIRHVYADDCKRPLAQEWLLQKQREREKLFTETQTRLLQAQANTNEEMAKHTRQLAKSTFWYTAFTIVIAAGTIIQAVVALRSCQ